MPPYRLMFQPHWTKLVVESETKRCNSVQSAEAFDFKGVSGFFLFRQGVHGGGCSGGVHGFLNTGCSGCSGGCSRSGVFNREYYSMELSSNTAFILRKYLFSRGFRYIKNDPKLPGKPDVVLPKYKCVVFVNGCFWHQHGCKFTSRPKTRSEFWNNKFDNNVARDVKTLQQLSNEGFRVAVVWECSLKNSPDRATERLVQFILGNEEFLEI